MDSQSQDHPLLLELISLRSTVARFQDEAYASAVKLQRLSLDKSNGHERAGILERENDWLKAEIAVLRANPTPSNSSNSTVEQVQQLTLSLRRLSEKLTLTEAALSTKTAELAQANAELLKARLAVENAYEVSARVRGREEAAKIREHKLEWQLKSAEEEKKISEVAVGEYANLVRSMEARAKVEGDPFKHSGDALANSLEEGKLGLKRLLSDFQSDTEELQRQLGQLRGELEVVKSNNEAERKGTQLLHLELAKAQAELQMLKIDDNTAARMVSRYMQFSQTSTNALQSTLSALKTRHTATLSTLTSTSYSLASKLQSAENMINRLRASLDELGGEIMKETYGRRREVALRVKFLGREEKMLEGLRRWLRKGEEAVSDVDNEAEDSQSRVQAALLGMTQDARILLEGLDDGFVTDSASLSGSLARVVLAQGLVDGLVEELKMETAKRMDLEKVVLPDNRDPAIVMLNGSDVNQRPLVSVEQENPPDIPSFSPSATPLKVITVHPLESEPNLSEEAQPRTTGIDTTLLNTNPPDIPSPTTKDDLVPSESTSLTNETITAANEHNPPVVYTHTSEDSTLTPSHVSTTISLANTTESTESLPVDVQLTLPNSTPTPDIVIDADIAQPPHICAEIANSVYEEVNKHSDLVITETDVASQDTDLSVEVSVPAGPGPKVELVINEPTLTVLPPSPPNLYSATDPAVQSNSATHPSTITSAGQPAILLEKEEIKISTSHPLLAELTKISHRYDDFQRSFRDCHLALEGLKASLGTTTSSHHQLNLSSIGLTRGKPPELILTPVIPLDILHAAVSRLDDYTEDVRVEIEIRISDEEVLAKGYEVLLCVPEALYSASTPFLSPSDQHHGQIDRHLSQSHSDCDDSSSVLPTQSELQIKIQAFISGTDPSVAKACEGFSKKLEDVQHDIAVLKRAIHDPDPEMMTMADGPELASETTTTPETGGRGWTSWIRSTARPSTPFSASTTMASAKHFGSSPTFGSIMTSPHRLKHSPSLNLNAYGNQKSRDSKAIFTNGNGSNWMQGGDRDDVLGKLGLRVPMPIFDSAVHQSLPSSSSAAVGGWGWNASAPIKPRSASSTMYMLGLGASPMTTSARLRGTSHSSIGSQNGDDPAVAMGVGMIESVGSVKEIQSRGPMGLVNVDQDNVEHETMDTKTKKVADHDVE